MVLDARSREVVLLLLAPALALGLGAFFHWRHVDEIGTSVLVSAIASSGALSSVLAFFFLGDALRLRRALAHLRRGGGGFSAFGRRDDASDQGARNQLTRLRREVDRLSAVRDLSLVANDGVDRELVLEKALTVIEGLVEAHDIRIFLYETQGELSLDAIAVRTKEKTRIKKTGEPPLGIAPRRAAKALAAKRRIGELGPSALAVATLLVADGEVMGALEVAIPRRGRDEAWAREVEDDLDLLAKHVALAIRKPALYDRAVSDGLTGLGTKRHFVEQARVLIAQARRLGTPLSLVVLDIDHFKRVNDTHGHVAGDRVLAEVAERLRATIRGYDLAFRYGGEELAVLAPNTRLDEAQKLAERLRLCVARSPVRACGAEIQVTASFGVASFENAMDDVSSLVASADAHLYVAKREGRNQVQPPLAAAPSPAPAPAEKRSAERRPVKAPPPPRSGGGPGWGSEAAPVPGAVPVPVRAPVPAAVPVPTAVPAPAPAPVPVPATAPVPVPVLAPVTAAVPAPVTVTAAETAPAPPAPKEKKPPEPSRRREEISGLQPAIAALPLPPSAVEW
ncbi:GGDEF domain-containing protein [bacterium]|nr:GGDEF domain-containing protein [bacterium]